MNRIIKFRTYNKDLHQLGNRGMYEVLDLYWIDHRVSEIVVYNPREGEKNLSFDYSEIDAGDVILMQFTGLLDKNGKEIYEGDIVFCTVSDRANNPERGVREIYWGKDFSFCFREFGYDFGLPLSWMGYETIEIIGNIYENPELLTKKT